MDDFAAAKGTPDYEKLKSLLGSRAWRLDNLYRIRNKDGKEIAFKRNAAQQAYFSQQWYRDIIVKARQLGMSTAIDLFICDTCTFRSNVRAAIIDETLTKAEEKLDMVQFAYDRLPPKIKAARWLRRSNTQEIEWGNGSYLTIGTSYRGGTLQMLHVSEMGKIAVNRPKDAREIKTGSLQAVALNGFCAIESTAHGTSGEFYDLVNSARNTATENRQLTQLDFKMHFYGWWIDPSYRIPNNLVVISSELKEYFTVLRVKYGIKLDADQMAWYAVQHKLLGPDDVKSEYPSTADETFFNSVLGAYWKRELTQARKDGRIGQMVPHDPTRRVNTGWDIGEDGTIILFHQTDGVRNRLIDFYEETGGSLQSAAAYVDDRARTRGFIYDKHYGPHDLDNKEWGNKAKTRKAMAKELGIDFTVVDRIEDKADSIEAGRRMLGNTWIDSEHCGRVVDAFDNYRKKWNDTMGVFLPDPVHDWTSHFGDALQQLAMGLKPESVVRRQKRRDTEKKGSAWTA